MTSTVVSWGLTICLVGAAIYVYKPELLSGLTSQAQEVKSAVTETSTKAPSKKSKSKKTAVSKIADEERTDSASDSQSSRKRKIISAPVDKSVTVTTTDGKEQQLPRSSDDGLNDKDFAKQLAQAQSGTKLQVPQKQQPSKKDRRASKLGASGSPDPSGFSTEASSTAGRDADDDLTPAESPQTQPPTESASRAGDISDMLEAPGAKPTTLRLTDISTDNKVKKSTNKAFEPVLSKKKRNEQQRKEESRLAREESDRIHEAKKQEQLRKARMAAGTSNQTKANNFAAKANAWQSGASMAVKTAPQDAAEPLLDTFETSSTAAPAHGAVHTHMVDFNDANEIKAQAGKDAAAALTASTRREGLPSKQQEYVGELSEEDQIKMLTEQQQEDAWESVTSKKSKKRGKLDNNSNSGASSPVRAAPPASKVPNNNAKVNGTVKNTDTSNRFTSFQDTVEGGLQDAEWEA